MKEDNVELPPVKRRVGLTKLPGNASKERIFSQSNDSVSFFAPSNVENELQGDQDDLYKLMFVGNETKNKPEKQTGGNTSTDKIQ